MNPESTFRPALASAMARALDYLEAPADGPVAATASTAELRSRLARPLGQEGLPAEQVIDELAADVAGGLLRSTGGRFFAWVIGGTVPAALGADWLTAAWDQNAASLPVAPAAAVVEEVCGAWLLDLLRLPPTASFALTSGCQMAHFTCLAAARNAVLGRLGWDVEARGLAGAPPIRVVANGLHHGSIERTLRFLGLGTGCLMDLPADDQGSIRSADLEVALAAFPGEPCIVLLGAGDINTGACDRFREIIPVAHRHGAWVHVDGAFGLWANASARYRSLLDGIELADSWATDGHKWLNVPYDSGYAFVAEPSAQRNAMMIRASYLVHTDEGRDQHDWNPEWSRRARGFATYAALRQLGRAGVADLVERCCRHARALVERLGAVPGVQVAWLPTLNQGLVSFPDARPGATGEDHDANTDRVIAAIVRDGRIMVGGTTWRGRRCMRISVCNWQTCGADVDAAVAAVRSSLA